MRSEIDFHKSSGSLRHEAANLEFRSSQEAQPEPDTARLQPCAASLEHLNRTSFDDALLRKTIGKAQQGDAAAFETIYHLYRARVYSLCLRMLHDPTDAEDALQDAFLQLFRKIQTFRGESAFSSWLHRLAVNVVLMRMRRKKPISVTLEETPNHDDETTAPAYEIGEPDLHLAGLADRLELQAAVDQLPKGYKKMFILHDVQGYQHSEIAQTLGLSIGNSKSQLHKLESGCANCFGHRDFCREIGTTDSPAIRSPFVPANQFVVGRPPIGFK
jgi:RNA polymerase sigma-70 factor, ECF subfamily